MLQEEQKSPEILTYINDSNFFAFPLEQNWTLGQCEFCILNQVKVDTLSRQKWRTSQWNGVGWSPLWNENWKSRSLEYLRYSYLFTNSDDVKEPASCVTLQIETYIVGRMLWISISFLLLFAGCARACILCWCMHVIFFACPCQLLQSNDYNGICFVEDTYFSAHCLCA